MKKKFHTFLINISLLFALILTIEVIIWQQENQTLRNQKNVKTRETNYPFHPGIDDFWINNPHFNYLRKPEGLEYSKKPIVIFGCSFAYGFNLQDDEILSYKLSHQAKVPVYNRAFAGWGIQHMLFQTKLDYLYDIIPEPEYAIYVYIPDHMNRLYYHSFILFDTLIEKYNLRYELKNGKLQEVKHDNFLLNQIKRLYLYNKINQYFIIKTQKNAKHYDFAMKHFFEAKEEMQKHWKNTKYVVVFYTAYPNDNYLKEKLKENDFIVIDADELAEKNLRDDKYMRPDYHPTGKAWDVIVPKLIKELGI